MADNAVGVVYNRLHHFLTEAPWSYHQINERRLEVMNQCSQTRITRESSLILDDSGHRKSGNFTNGVGRQYLGEIGKTDNGIVVVTTPREKLDNIGQSFKNCVNRFSIW
jgi:SRSO17 transposase